MAEQGSMGRPAGSMGAAGRSMWGRGGSMGGRGDRWVDRDRWVDQDRWADGGSMGARGIDGWIGIDGRWVWNPVCRQARCGGLGSRTWRKISQFLRTCRSDRAAERATTCLACRIIGISTSGGFAGRPRPALAHLFETIGDRARSFLNAERYGLHLHRYSAARFRSRRTLPGARPAARSQIRLSSASPSVRRRSSTRRNRSSRGGCITSTPDGHARTSTSNYSRVRQMLQGMRREHEARLLASTPSPIEP